MHSRRLLAIGCAAMLLVPALIAADPSPPPPRTYEPDLAGVQRCGPGYRYPQAGWIVVHIEGEPYERGYQYGKLLGPEIAGYAKALGLFRCPKDAASGWKSIRTLVNALFLRRYDLEFLEEMKGIADGAAAAGAKFEERPLDLLDVVAVNSSIEIDFLEAGLNAAPTGLEGKKFNEPPYAKDRKIPAGHCSSFAATGSATVDGKVVIGHITMWNLFHVRYFNVWLDVKPTKGHRILMQTFPGGIMSGMDYYQNDAGLVLTETTIEQTKFDANGWSLVARCRKAMQYSNSIDDMVRILKEQNNGLYSNEWLMADTKTNEIAMFELGTDKNRLWRSSKNEWPGGTEGFYWGCNNTKDLHVRMETICATCERPANMTFRPSERDIMWIKLYQENKGKIDEKFGFKAFTTAPLAAFPSCDAKFTTTAMAKELKSWAIFGPPLGRTWEPTEEEKATYGKEIQPLVSNDWTMLSGKAVPSKTPEIAAVDLGSSRTKLSAAGFTGEKKDDDDADGTTVTERNPAWHGTLLPKTDADIWLAVAFADYEHIVALEKSLMADGKLDSADQQKLALAMYVPFAKYRMAVQRLGHDIPLAQTKADAATNDWHDLATGKGVLLLNDLRKKMGAAKFDAMMDEFGRANAGKEVTTAMFQAHAESAYGSSLESFLKPRLESGDNDEKKTPPRIWSITGFEKDLDNTLIVYGTGGDRAAQREAAHRLQRAIARRFGNFYPEIKADKNVTEDDLRENHLLLIGRPETNLLTPGLASGMPVQFGPRSFTLNGETYAAPDTAVVVAGRNPKNSKRCIVVYAGLSADATWRCVDRLNAPPCDALVIAGDMQKPAVTAGPTPESTSEGRKLGSKTR